MRDAVNTAAEKQRPELLEVSAAARLLGLSAATVRRHADQGRLHAQRTATGSRIFARSELERVIRERR